MRHRLLLVFTAGLSSACADAPVTSPATRLSHPDADASSLTPITIHYCGGTPTWSAYRNQGGEWTALNFVDTTVTFSVTQRFGFVYIHVFNDTYVTVVTYMTVRDSLMFPRSCPIRDKAFNGTVAGVEPGVQSAMVAAGGRTAYNADDVAPWSLNSMIRGYVDILAGRRPISENGNYVMNKIMIRRNRNPQMGATLPVFDFGSAKAVTPVLKNVSITGVAAGEQPYVYTRFKTPTSVLQTTVSDGEIPATIPFVPHAQLRTGDLQVVYAGAYNDTSSRAINSFLYDPNDVSVTLPPQVAAPHFTVLSMTPYMRVRAHVTRQPKYDAFHQIEIFQHPHYLYLTWTADYYRTTPDTWLVDEPNLSGAAGFDPAWMLQPDVAATWDILGKGRVSELAARAGTSWAQSTLFSNQTFTPGASASSKPQ